MAKKKESQNIPGEFNSSPKTNIAYIDGLTFFSKAVQYAEVEGLAMFEGDIILGTVKEVENKTNLRGKELRGEVQMGVVLTGAQFRWPNCTVPYTIDPGLPSQNRVTDAIAHWEANTNVSFVLRTNANAGQYPDYVTFRSGNGCSSYVGKIGGQQFVNLGAGCTTGNAIHEIGHTVGLWHEQSRQDRDSFVTIHWDKIIPGYENNFTQHITDGDDVGAYEYGSLMHYPRDAFSIDGSDTITPLNPNAQIGQRNGLSSGDIATVNSIYTCGQVCPPGPVIQCNPSPFVTCAPGPHVYCAVGPICQPAPKIQCVSPVVVCRTAPIQKCPPSPRQVCPPLPAQVCPPSARICPPAVRLTCPPAARVAGCYPGAWIDPRPVIPEIYGRGYNMGQDPYGYGAGAYGYPAGYPSGYPSGQYYDPYGYGNMQGYGDPYGYPNWTAYEYPDPCQSGYGSMGYYYPNEPFNPNYW